MKTDRKNKKESQQSEAVLVLQGGGSLGAYECGVYKKLYEHGIKFDILAGSSIGAINASIICSAQNANKVCQIGFREVLAYNLGRYRIIAVINTLLIFILILFAIIE